MRAKNKFTLSIFKTPTDIEEISYQITYKKSKIQKEILYIIVNDVETPIKMSMVRYDNQKNIILKAISWYKNIASHKNIFLKTISLEEINKLYKKTFVDLLLIDRKETSQDKLKLNNLI